MSGTAGRGEGRGESQTELFRRVLACLVGALVMMGAGEASAYPWMIQHGFQACASCHDDPSGGELLTEYGRGQGYDLLPSRYGAGWNRQTQPLWGKLPTPDGVRVGGSYRHLSFVELDDPIHAASFPMQADLYAAVRLHAFRAGASIGAAKVPAGSPHARAAQITSADGDRLNLISRSHWIGYELTPRTLLRAGRINLPYGLRIPEHVAWVRDFSRTDRESDQQHGVALAFQSDRARGELMAILGNYQIHPDRFRERGGVGFVEWLAADEVALGVSALATTAGGDPITLRDEPVTREVSGLFARLVPFSSLVVLAEGDVLLASHREAGYLGFLQADYQVVQGLHLLATGEMADEGRLEGSTTPSRPGFGQPRYGGWLSLDWHFLPQFSARIDAVARQDAPFTLFSQLHVYL